MFAANLNNSAQGILLTDLIEHYHLTAAKQGLMATAQGLGSVIASVSIIFLANKMKRHNIILVSVTLVMGSMFFIGLLPPYSIALALYVVCGLGQASAGNVSSSFISQLFSSGSVPMGTLHAAFGLGGVLGPIILQAVRANISGPWNSIIFVAVGIELLAFGYYLFAVAHTRPLLNSLKTYENKIDLHTVKDFVTSKRNLLLLAAAFCYSAFQNGVSVWVARYLELEFNAQTLGAITLSIFWAAATLSRLVVPRIGIPVERLICTGCAVSTVLLLIGLSTSNPFLAMCCIVTSGFASGASVPQFYYLACQWNSQNTVLATSIAGITMYFGNMLTAPLTASFASVAVSYGMYALTVYVLLSCILTLPLARANRIARQKTAE